MLLKVYTVVSPSWSTWTLLLFRGVPFPMIAWLQVSVPLNSSPSACGRGFGRGHGRGRDHGHVLKQQDRRLGRLPEVSLSWISMILYIYLRHTSFYNKHQWHAHFIIWFTHFQIFCQLTSMRIVIQNSCDKRYFIECSVIAWTKCANLQALILIVRL